MTAVRLLAFAGSLRTGSFNKRLVQVAAQGARDAGAEVTYLELRDFPMPIFDEDLEKAEGMPAPAARFKQLLVEHDGFLLAAPEYNSSITAVLKNSLDWATRSAPGEPALIAFQKKWAVLMSASPGALGGLRGLVTVRSILSNVGVFVLPTQVAVARAFEAFNDDGSLKDTKQQAAIQGLGRDLADVVRKVKTSA